MPLPEVVTTTIEKQVLQLDEELPGRTEAFRVAEIRPQVNGLIQKRLFTEGTDVEEGQSLYQIDPRPFEATLNSAKAGLARAQATLPALESRVTRYSEALADNAVSQQDFDDASANRDQAQADILYYEALCKNSEINLEYTKVISPISGRIGLSTVTDGAIVTAYQQIPLTTVTQLDPIYVNIAQSTADIMSLKKRLESGVLEHDKDLVDKVDLYLEDGTLYLHQGKLQFQDISVDPTTSSVTLRVVFPNPEGKLLPGMYVKTKIHEGVDKNAILIPQESLQRDHKGNPYVLLVSDNKVERQYIAVDRALNNQWLVTSGLNGGEQLIIEGFQGAKVGAEVKVLTKGEAEKNKN